MTRDPMGYAGGVNLYNYTGNDPVNESDPLGFCGGGNPISNFYWGGMGGLSNWVSNNLLAGTDKNLGSTVGDYDAGNASAWDVAGAGAMLAGNVALNVVPGGEEARGAEFAEHVADAEVEKFAASACFIANTPVQMADGTVRLIPQIKQGDSVQSRNAKTGKTEVRRVVRVFKHLAHETLTVHLADAHTGRLMQTLTATAEHRFFVADRGAIPLGQMGIGTLIVTRAGPPLVVKSVVKHEYPQGIAVYNFEVQGDHTYFVGTANGGTWVHNNCSGLGDLTNEEVSSIQSVVEEAGRPLEVGGSAAKGMRRGVGSDLPIGKGTGTASDIDYLVPPGSMDYYEGLAEKLPGIDPSTGILSAVGNPHMGPVIRFEPGATPMFISGAE